MMNVGRLEHRSAMPPLHFYTAIEHFFKLSSRMASSSTQSDLSEFSKILSSSLKVTVLTGAGVSAESGIPTFRGAGGLWRTWNAMELATPGAFTADPSLVWEFYHYRRGIARNAAPNPAHYALATLEKQCEDEGKKFQLITQNIDGLHLKAGSKNVVELHGSLWKTRCCRCDDVLENHENVICPALEGKGAPDPNVKDARIPDAELPRCKKCNGLLRPHVVWFGEMLDPEILDQAENALIDCDLFLVAGTSAVVQPAAAFVPVVQGGGGIVAEFNLDETPISRYCRFEFIGPDRSTFFSYVECSSQSIVHLEDDKACQIAGIGSFRLKQNAGPNVTLHNVRHIPEIERKLI